MRTRRKTRRFRERLTAVLAVAGAATLMTGFVVTGTAGTAQATGGGSGGGQTTCDSLGYTKGVDEDKSSGNKTYDFGTLSWGGTTLSYDIKANYVVDLCIKSGHGSSTESAAATTLGGMDKITLFSVTGAAVGSKVITKQISHIGYKFTYTPPAQPSVISLKLTYMVDCDLTTNRWRVRNETGETVQTTYAAYGGGASGSHSATPGDSFFTTPYGSETMKLKWGDGQTIAYGETVKASGGDGRDCEPEKIVVTPEGQPEFKDPCGTRFDKTIMPADTELVDWVKTVEGSTVTVTAQLQHNLPPYYVLAEGDWTWTHTFTDEPCFVKVDLDLSFVPDCLATHQWKVTNPSDIAVTAWYGLGKSVLVPANGTATFTTDPAKDYAFIFWGGKGTGIWPGFEKEHAGADRTDCNYTPPPQPVLIPVTPEITYTDPCGTVDDTVNGVTKTGYTFVVDPAAGKVTFTAVPGYYISGPTTLTAPWTDVPCPVEATPVAPTVVQSDECEVEGSYTIPDTPGVQYLLDGEPVEPGTYSGPIAAVVTAEPGDNTVLTVEDWTFDLVVTPASDCEVAPSEAVDVCTNIKGAQAAVPEGYTLVEGLCVADEVAPTEGVAPTAPAVGPVVVPTAVDAGLAGPAGAETGMGSPLGLALISAGLMMLLAAGALQTGRRERGTHEI